MILEGIETNHIAAVVVVVVVLAGCGVRGGSRWPHLRQWWCTHC